MEPKRAVLDTNVLVSGVLSAGGPPGRIVDLLVAGHLHPVVDLRVLAEYSEVLHRPELKLTGGRLDPLLATISRNALLVIVRPWKHPLPDPDDEPFLALADAALCPLVTGNAKHFPTASRGGVTVLSPREFLEQIFG